VTAATVLLAAAGIWYLHAGPADHEAIALLPPGSLADPVAQKLSQSLTSELKKALLASAVWNVQVLSRNGDLQSAAEPVPKFVLRTSFETNDTTVTLIAELMTFADREVVWRDMFQRNLAVFIDMQDVVASAIVSSATRQARKLVLPSAEESYTWARERWGSGDVPGWEESLPLFRRAVHVNPNFAPAWSGYADANLRLSDDGGIPNTKREVGIARDAAWKAIELDSDNAEAHDVLGRIALFKDWDFRGAVKHLGQAVAIQPMRIRRNIFYSRALAAAGDLARSQEAIQAARKLLPPLPEILLQEGSILFLAHDFKRLEAVGRELMTMEPDLAAGPWLVGLSLEQQGDVAQAVVEFQNGLKAKDDLRTLCALSHAFAVIGNRKAALSTMRHFLPDPGAAPNEFTPCYCAALTHAGLGEVEVALDWLEKAKALRDAAFPFLRFDPRFDGLKGHPRYLALVSRRAS
jgi:tetratricopeptide (TPR) repeat protein